MNRGNKHIVRIFVNGFLGMLALCFIFLGINVLVTCFTANDYWYLVYCALACILATTLLHYAITYVSRKPETVEENKSIYNDVSSIPKVVIGTIGLFTILFVYLGLLCCFPIDYTDKYPRAEIYFSEQCEMSSTNIALLRSLPQWMVNSYYAQADGIQKALELKEDTSIEDEEREARITGVAAEMNEAVSESKLDMVLCLVCFYFAGVLHSLSVRCQQYHTNMRRIESNRDKGDHEDV